MLRTILLAGLALNVFAADAPSAEISNGHLRAKLYLPDVQNGYYRGTRFDWSGVIASLEHNGHSYFGQWFDKYDPKIHDAIMGPVEEFVTGDSAPGYADAKPGETFLRIGVGMLRKPKEEKFQRFFTYEIADHGKWTVHAKGDRVEFIQDLNDKSTGFGYRYRKIVRLVPGKPEMFIEHTLKNTGRKRIDTDTYNHNFFVIDGQQTGPGFSVEFPYKTESLRDLNGLAEMRDTKLVYVKTQGPSDRMMTELKGYSGDAKDYQFRVANEKTGAAVRVSGDKPLLKVLFWSAPKVLSPEPYISLTIEPGKEVRWKIRYEFEGKPR